jgi:hypothetical protein
VSPQGCLAVDALVEPRDREALPAAPD